MSLDVTWVDDLQDYRGLNHYMYVDKKWLRYHKFPICSETYDISTLVDKK